MEVRHTYKNSLFDWCKTNNRDDILNEWDKEKNGHNTPFSVQYGSGKKMWWLCQKGHSYECTPNGKTSSNAGCPYCLGKKVLKGYNDLATTNPALADEWDYEKNTISPMDVTKGANEKVWWRCLKGHSFQAIINNRTKGQGCPYCSGKKPLIGYNDFEIWCKNNGQLVLLQEWDQENNKCLASEILPHSEKKVWWICSICGKRFESSVAVRTRNCSEKYIKKYGARIVSGCPSCSQTSANNRVNNSKISAKGSLADIYPEIALEWDCDKNNGLLPSQVLASSNKKVWWICSNQHSYEATINHRTNGTGCPICTGKKVLPGFNDIATTNPELLKTWNYEKNKILPCEISAGSEKKVWWKCNICGNEWLAVVYSRGKNGCPKCSKGLRTSFPEQTIFYYISQLFPDAINGDRHLGKEFDVYIPSKKIAIEYDGYKWHTDIQRDIEKNEICSKEGFFLYRIRENGCPSLPHFENVKILMLEPGNRMELSKTISSICSHIAPDKTIHIDIARDEGNIYELYISGVKNNSLAKKHPELLIYWDYEKNKTISPEHVTEATTKKFWWKCEKGHSYKQAVNSKSKGLGCPICSQKKVLQGYNDLKTLNPELAKEWHPTKNGNWLPSEFALHSGKKVWWLGKCGHEWESTIYVRSTGAGCPFCSKPPRKILAGFNDLLTLFPNISEEWDYNKNDVLIQNISTYSNKKVWWLCSKKHSYLMSVDKKVNGLGCPICSNHRIVYGINDLSTTNPELLAEWDYGKNIISPIEISRGYNRKVWWKCKKNHSWEATVNSRVNGTGCPICKNKTIISGINDLATTNPELLTEWDYNKNSILPTEISKGSNAKIWWICKKDHSWKATVSSRISGRGCPVCKNKIILPGVNDLATTNPELLTEWDYNKNQIEPTHISYGSTQKIWWICEKGHSYCMNANARTSKRAGCPYCSNQLLLRGFNDLATTNPELAKEWDYDKNTVRPEDIQGGTHKKIWWICKNGHSWKASVSNRQKCGCPFCSNRKVLKGFNDLATTNPELLKEWDYDKNTVTPSEVSAGMGKKVWWICAQGHSYQAALYSRKAGRGCIICGRKSAGKKKEKQVILIEEQRLFPSINDAAKYCQISPSAIGLCCKGKNKTAGGYHWKYAE